MNRKITVIFIGLFIALGMSGCTQAEVKSSAGSQSGTSEHVVSSQPADSMASEQNTSSAASEQSAASSTDQAVSGVITEAQAKAAALELVGLDESDVTFTKVKLEYDDGKQIYDIEFYAENTEYDFEIDAATGTVLSYDNDYEGDIQAVTVQGSDIGIEAAQEIALAKVSGATADDIRIYQDYEDRTAVYEGTIVYNERKYDFEIKADDGTILEWEEESVYDD